MFEIGEYVMSTGNGICRIEDITHPEFVTSNSDKMYYLVVPVDEKTSKLYIPTDNAVGKIRGVMKEEEVDSLVNEIPHIEEVWVDNDKQRENAYKQYIASEDPRKLVSIIKSIYNRKQERMSNGKKSTAVDDRYFKLAEHILYSELAFVLGKETDEMEGFIAQRIHES